MKTLKLVTTIACIAIAVFFVWQNDWQKATYFMVCAVFTNQG